MRAHTHNELIEAIYK